MKGVVLLIAFVSLFFTPVYSQINENDKTDSTLRDQSNLRFRLPSRSFDPIDFKPLLNGPKVHKDLRIPEYSEWRFDIGQDIMGRITQRQFNDNMPCLRPRGYFPMVIVQPDRTIKYSLLIKRY